MMRSVCHNRGKGVAAMIRRKKWIEHLVKIYQDPFAAEADADKMEMRFNMFENSSCACGWLTEKDVMLITCGDTIAGYIRQYGSAQKNDVKALRRDKLSDVLTEEKKNSKISNTVWESIG